MVSRGFGSSGSGGGGSGSGSGRGRGRGRASLPGLVTADGFSTHGLI